MKKFRFYIFLIVSPLLLSFTSGPGDVYCELEDFTFQPLVVTETNNLVFDFKARSVASHTVKAKLLLSNRTYEDFVIKEESFPLSFFKKYSFVVTLPPWTVNTNSNYFRLEVYYEGVERKLPFTLGGYFNGDVTLPTHEVVKSNYQGVIYEKGVLTNFFLIFDFMDYGTTVEYKDDLRLSLEDFITHYHYDNVNYESVHLVFPYMSYLFPKLAKNEAGHPNLELKITQEDGKMRFSLLNPIYVDDETHLISAYKEEGFRITSHIYLPKNSREDLEFHTFRLEIKGFGPLKLNVNYHFKLQLERDYISRQGTYGIHYYWGTL